VAKSTNKSFKLDELLSPAALEELKAKGFVCFEIGGSDGQVRSGWFSRKTEYTPYTIEHIVVNMPIGG
jgi:hypothetical protein